MCRTGLCAIAARQGSDQSQAHRRIQATPSPIRTSQWNLAQGSRSSRAGTSVSTTVIAVVRSWLVIIPLPEPDAIAEQPLCDIAPPINEAVL